MGSKFIFTSAEDFYILGLWLADGYWRSSSIGLTSVHPLLVERFRRFLQRVVPGHPIKERLYEVKKGEKRRQTATQIYVNCRPLLRVFFSTKTGVLFVPKSFLPAYLAGRIDGDGHVDQKHRSGIRIAYGNKQDAWRDQQLFGRENMSLYQYKAAGTHILYVKKHYREQIVPFVRQYSIKLAP